MLLQECVSEARHPINSCHLKAGQSDWLHAWLLILLCSCTLTCTHTQSELQRHKYILTSKLGKWHTHTLNVQTHRHRNKENTSCHVIFPGLALTGSLSKLKDHLQSVTTACTEYYIMLLLLLLYSSLIDCACMNGCVWDRLLPNTVPLWRSSTTVDATSGYTPHKSLQWRVEIKDSLQCMYQHINHPYIIHAFTIKLC